MQNKWFAFVAGSLLTVGSASGQAPPHPIPTGPDSVLTVEAE